MSTTTSATSASTISTQYLNLLITQLQNQNPLEPMDNNQMTAQLTGLSQLQQIESLNSSFSKVLAAEQMGQASSLIGKKVSFIPSGGTALQEATVDGIVMSSGEPMLHAGNYTINVSDVQTIRN